MIAAHSLEMARLTARPALHLVVLLLACAQIAAPGATLLSLPVAAARVLAQNRNICVEVPVLPPWLVGFQALMDRFEGYFNDMHAIIRDGGCTSLQLAQAFLRVYEEVIDALGIVTAAMYIGARGQWFLNGADLGLAEAARVARNRVTAGYQRSEATRRGSQCGGYPTHEVAHRGFKHIEARHKHAFGRLTNAGVHAVGTAEVQGSGAMPVWFRVSGLLAACPWAWFRVLVQDVVGG